MPDGTVSGRFELDAEQPIRSLGSIRDAAGEADTSIRQLGTRMDELGRKRSTPTISLSGADSVTRQLDDIAQRLDSFGNSRSTATVSLAGVTEVKAQLRELELLLSRFADKRATANVSIDSGGVGGIVASRAAAAAAGGGNRGGGANRLALLAGAGGIALAIPFAPQILGAVGAIGASAGAAGLGAASLGLGAAGFRGVATVDQSLVTTAFSAVSTLATVEQAYATAVQNYGPNSTQAKTARLAMTQALAQATPAAAGAARQYTALQNAYANQTAPGQAALQRSISQGSYTLRSALPAISPALNQLQTVTGQQGVQLTKFLTDPQSIQAYQSLISSFTHDLPIIEPILQNVARTLLNLSVAAQPFFTQALVWVKGWTGGLATATDNQAKVTSTMGTLITSTKDWGKLLITAGTTLKDLFVAGGNTAGNSLVGQLTSTLDTWDQWIRNNPQKIRDFFQTGIRDLENVATVVGNIAKDISQLFSYLSPILDRATEFLKFASGLGGGSLLTGAGVLFAGYTGAQRALGGGGPTPGGAVGSFIFGGVPRTSGGGTSTTTAAGAAARTAAVVAAQRTGGTYLLPPAGYEYGTSPTPIGRLSLPSTYLPQTVAAAETPTVLPIVTPGGMLIGRTSATATADLLAARGVTGTGERAFQQAYGSYAPESRFALPTASATRAEAIAAGTIQPTALEKGAAAVGGAARAIAPILLGLSVLQGIGAAAQAGGGPVNIARAGISTGLSALTLGTVPARTISPVALPIAGAAAGTGLSALLSGLPGALGSRGLSLGSSLLGGAGVAGLADILPVVGAYAGLMLNPGTTAASLGPMAPGLKSLATQATQVNTSAQFTAVLNQLRSIRTASPGSNLSPSDAAKLQASLNAIATRGLGGSLARQAATVTTPAGAYQIKAEVNQLEMALTPAARARFQSQADAIIGSAFQHAGNAAASTWENAFTSALGRGATPTAAVSTMLSGMMKQLQDLGPQGARAMATNVAAWAQSMEKSNPKLIAPMEKLMSGITSRMNTLDKTTGTTWKDIQDKIFYFNGQILTGSTKTWQNIGNALTNPSQVAQEKLYGIWGAIQQEAINALTQMGFAPSSAKAIVTAAAKGGTLPTISPGPVGSNAPTAGKGPGGVIPAHARGGMLGGRGLLDTVPMPDGSMAAPGEAYIANRHTMRDLDLAAIYMYGKTAWQMIGDETRTHSSPMRSRGARYFTTGGRSGPVASGSATTGSAAGYIYPWPSGTTIGRTDMGVDANMPVGSPIGPIGNAKILGINQNWYQGQPYMWWQLTSGPDAGKMVYVAEQITPLVHPGQTISAGQAVATYAPSGTGIEMGWAAAGGQTLAQATTGYTEGQVTAAGSSFRSFLAGLQHGRIVTSGAPGSGSTVNPVSLKAPGTGVGGVPGAIGNQAARILAFGLQQAVNKKVGATSSTGGGTPGGRLVTASDFTAGPQTASGHTYIPGFAELSNPPSSLNFSALGGLPMGELINVTYNGKTITIPKIDVGAGGNAISPATVRAIDLSMEAANMLNFSGLANVTWNDTGRKAAGFARGGRMAWGGWHAQGADFITNGPTVFGAGEQHRERVTITPMGRHGRGGGRELHVHFHDVRFGGTQAELDQTADYVAGKILESLDRIGQGVPDNDLLEAPA